MKNRLLPILFFGLLTGLMPLYAQDAQPLLDSVQWQAALEKYQYQPFQEQPDVDIDISREWDLVSLRTIFIIFSIALVVVLIGIFLYYYRFRKNKPIIEEEATAYFKSIEENLDKTDLEPEINKAIDAGKYDFALRLLHLNTLKLLDAHSLIDFLPNKPNGEYVSAIRIQFPGDTRFANLTLWFERVWYGKRPIDRTMFEKLHIRFVDYSKFIIENNPDER